MSETQIPLIRSNNQIYFDIETIESRRFIKQVLHINKNTDFKFKHFGFCKDSNFFYLVLKIFEKDETHDDIYKFTIDEFNEEYYIKNIEKLGEYDTISCEFQVLA